MSINFDKAGPSGIQSERTEMFSNVAKENKDIEKLGEKFKIAALDTNESISHGKFSLKINEIYMNSFQNGKYNMPNCSMEVYSRHPHNRCYKRKRREKYHPYLTKDLKLNKSDYIFCSRVQDAFESPYRLRTTSLTSGTARKRPTLTLKQSTNCELQRSKSMEDLNGTGDDCSQKSKDFDTVYKGIQQLHMGDNV